MDEDTWAEGQDGGVERSDLNMLMDRVILAACSGASIDGNHSTAQYHWRYDGRIPIEVMEQRQN